MTLAQLALALFLVLYGISRLLYKPYIGVAAAVCALVAGLAMFLPIHPHL